MDIMEIVFSNAKLDAQTNAKKLQTKSKAKDATRRARAKAANIRDAIERLSAWKALTRKHVHFGDYKPMPAALRLKSMFKVTV